MPYDPSLLQTDIKIVESDNVFFISIKLNKQ